MEPVVEKNLQGVPFSGMGSTLERNALIGVIKNLILESKYTVEYILNFCQSVGYQRKMAEEVFTELTGLSPKLIVNNNAYYKMPAYVPNMCIAWGMAKTKKDVAYYVVPFDYGYVVMEKNETEAPVPMIQTATIPEAIDELKKVAKNIQTLHKIVTKKLLETDDVQSEAKDVHQVHLPYSSDPIFNLKKSLKNKVISVGQFELKAKQLLAEDKLTVDEAEDLMAWKDELVEEDESYANEVLQHTEKWNDLEAGTDVDFDALYELRTSGNISLYKEKLNKLSKVELAQYIQWAEYNDIDVQDLLLNRITASKKIEADEEETLEEEQSKDDVQEEVTKIEETPIDNLLTEYTPSDYFNNVVEEDKVDTINDVVSKCIDKFSEKFKEFSRYTVTILSYNTKVLGDYKPNEPEMVPDTDINANAVLQIILSIANNADQTDIKKVLVIFTITNGKLNWDGTVRGENDKIVAFTEEGLDSLFETETENEELEDIV